MISKILIVIFVGIILAGLLGIRESVIKKKLLFLCITSVGITALSFAEVNAYGIVGGCLQLFFRLSSLVCLILLIGNICKKNEITTVEDIAGMGRNMPYLFATAVIFSVIIIGIPATGTFTGILYSEIGLLAGQYGVVTYIGLVGNVAGILISAAILFPLLKQAYFPGMKQETEDVQLETIQDEKSVLDGMAQREWKKPGKGIMVICLTASVILMVLCIYQKPVMTIAANLMEKIFG